MAMKKQTVGILIVCPIFIFAAFMFYVDMVRPTAGRKARDRVARVCRACGLSSYTVSELLYTAGENLGTLDRDGIERAYRELEPQAQAPLCDECAEALLAFNRNPESP